MKKGKLILLIILLIAAFVCAKILYDQVTQGQIADDPGISQNVEPSPAPAAEPEPETPPEPDEPDETGEIAWNYEEFPDDYTFRNKKLLGEHYEKHGIEMGFASEEEYEAAANLVIHHPDTLHKIEKEDGDTCFYYEEANLFVVLSTDGYIRTFFAPDSGKKYYDKQ